MQFSSRFLSPRVRLCQDRTPWKAGRLAHGGVISWVCTVAKAPRERRSAACGEAQPLRWELWPCSSCPAQTSRPSRRLWLALSLKFSTVVSAQPPGRALPMSLFSIDLETSWGLQGLAAGRQPGPALVLGHLLLPPHPTLILCPCPETDTQGRTRDFRTSGVTSSSLLLPPDLSEH